MSVLRDIFRRKARSILTISGIGVGVFALVVLGAVAENDNVYVEQLVSYYENAIVVAEKSDANFVGMSNGNRPISMDKIREIRRQPGVGEVSPQVNMLLNGTFMSVIPPMILGSEPGSRDYETFELAKGRALERDDTRAVLLGYDLAKQTKLGVGDTLDVRGEKFDVVGVLDRSYVNLTDSAAYVTLTDAQKLYYEALPEPFRGSVVATDLVMQANVYVKPGVNADEVAATLNRDVEGITATGPTKMFDTVNGLVGLLNTVVWSVAAMALLISGLSIINTMTISVSERTREIGVKRALGASRWRVARDVLAESAVMGTLGGIGGLALGALVTLGLNSAMVATTGTTAFLLTGRLAVGAVLFAAILGTFGGLYPARYASRLEPATALAHE
ncbi:MAG: ABC transporter permease [Coriobacteriia bacterium]|nr:ABC transporter permease [Coriobacteriia bacterium]